MPKKPTYEELEQRVRELETEVDRSKSNEEEFERERNIFLVSPVVIFKWIAKENWSTGYVSSNVTQFGYLAEDFMSGSVLYIDIVHPEDREKFVREAQECRESGVGSYEQEYRIIQADGETKWIYDFTVVGRNDKNEITHYDGYIMDITVRKLAEDALRRSERQASTAMEAARAFTFAYDIPTGKIEWGDAIEKITGDTPEEFSLVDIDGWAERIHPDDRDRVLSILQEAFQSDRAVAEYRFKTKHGDYITLSSISLTEEDEEGKAVRLVGILQDITEQKKAEEALEMGEARLRTILESAQDGIVLGDFDTGERQYVNQALADMLGYTKEQLLTMRFRDNVGPEAVEMFKDIGRKMIRTQKAVRGIECEMIKEDGSRIIVSSSETPLTNAEGRITSVVGIMRDVTDSKRAEEALQKAHGEISRLLGAVETAREAIHIASPDGIIIFTNHAMDELFGYDKGELIGKHESILNAESVSKTQVEEIVSALEKKESLEGEIDSRRKDGSKFISYATVGVLKDEDGKIVNTISTQHDITSSKQTENALRRSEEKYRNFLENLVDGAYETDELGNITYVNSATEKLIGKLFKDFSGRPFLPLLAKDSQALAQDVLARSLNGEDTGVYELEFVNGPICQFKNSLMKDENGKTIGVFGIMRDISKQRKAEEKAKKARDDYHTITTLIADIIVQVDAEGCFTFLNDHACTFWGYPRENMIGTSFYDYIHSDDRERSSDVIQKAIMEEREERGLINRQKTKEGYKTIEWNGVPFFDRNEQYIGFQASGRDITDRIQATENLKEMNSALKILLKQRDRDKNEIEEKVLTNVKELISPYLEKLHKSPLNDSQSNLLTIIESNIDEIVSPFLHRLSSKYSDLTPREIQVAGLVKDGKTTKEIAELLTAGVDAIKFHRSNLRLKLGLTNKKANLRSYLLSHMY